MSLLSLWAPIVENRDMSRQRLCMWVHMPVRKKLHRGLMTGNADWMIQGRFFNTVISGFWKHVHRMMFKFKTLPSIILKGNFFTKSVSFTWICCYLGAGKNSICLLLVSKFSCLQRCFFPPLLCTQVFLDYSKTEMYTPEIHSSAAVNSGTLVNSQKILSPQGSYEL